MLIKINIQGLIVFCVILGAFAPLFADLAPTQYRGWALSPKFDSRVQLVSETVDIYWGEICKVKAVFNLNNQSDSAIHMKIGFPVNLTYLKKKLPEHLFIKYQSQKAHYDTLNKIYDFTFILNGRQISETDIPKKYSRDDEQWYGWDCKIKPGANTIHLSYSVSPNLTYAYRWQENLYYVLHTGKFWDGKIDNAVVTVHFPQKISPDQIDNNTKPSGYKITDNSITWEFSNFEPTDAHNIHLLITSFKTFRKMEKFKTSLSNPQVDTRTKLDAAIFYASLTFCKGLNFTAPIDLDSTYYYSMILPDLTPEELNIFQQTYGKTSFWAVGLLADYNSFNEGEIQHIVKSALLRTRYYGNVLYKECWEFVELSSRLFQEVVAEEPKNAAAWLAYLENAYRIHPEGCNPCKYGFSIGIVGYFQKKIAIEAYKHCPDNPKIKAWYKFAVPHSAEIPDTIGKVWRQSIDAIEIQLRSRYSGSQPTLSLSTDDFNVIGNQYQISGNKYLVKTNSKTDDDTKKAIIDILYKKWFYHYRLCHELKTLK